MKMKDMWSVAWQEFWQGCKEGPRLYFQPITASWNWVTNKLKSNP